MRNVAMALLLLALVIATLPLSASRAQTQTYIEGFDSTALMDAAGTTAHWDVASGLLKLPVTQPMSARVLGTFSQPPEEFPMVYVPETGKAYVIGGLYHPINSPRLRSAAIWQYDPAANAMERTMSATLPTQRDSSAAAYASGARKVYIFGGADDTTQYKDILEFDPFADTLTVLPVQLPYRLWDSVAVYVPSSNRVYLFGGQNPDRITADIFRFDVATRTVQVIAAKLPTGRRSACAAFVAQTSRIYLFGGNNSAQVVVDEILAFDPSAEQLSLLTTRLPVGLERAACAHVPNAGKVFLIGGMEPAAASNHIYAFDPSAQTVAQCPQVLPGDGIWDSAAVYAEDSDWLALVGGYETLWPYGYPGILRFRCDGSCLSSVSSFLPQKSEALSAVYVPHTNSAYLFGGGRTSILQFDMANGTIVTETATLPLAANDPGAVWVPAEKRAYVFVDTHIYAYDPALDTLTAMPGQLPARFDPRVVTYVPSRNAIYAFDSTEGSGLIVRYNLADHSLFTLPTRLLPARRAAYAHYVPASNLVFILGGWEYPSQVFLSDIMILDVATETLSRQQGLQMPMPGQYKASAQVPGTRDIYALGGWGGWSLLNAGFFERIWEFDTTTPRRFVTHTLTLPELLGDQALVWASAEDCFYAFGGRQKRGTLAYLTSDHIARFDFGHATQAAALSTRINSGPGAVQRATLLVTERSNSSGTVDYFLSNNEGTNWEVVTPGVEHVFVTLGSDLRWKALLHSDGRGTPVIDELSVDWQAAQPTVTDTATSTSTHTPTATATASPSATATATVTTSPTATASLSATASATLTQTATSTPTATATWTPAATATATIHLHKLFLPLITR